MPGSLLPWPELSLVRTQWQMTGEPPGTYKTRAGSSYIDLVTKSSSGNMVATTYESSAIESSVGQKKVSIARLWATGRWGLVYNKDTKMYSAVKLFRVDLAQSQDELEQRMPRMFWNNFSIRPYPVDSDIGWTVLTQSRSPYVTKTSTEFNEWLQQMRQRAAEIDSGQEANENVHNAPYSIIELALAEEEARRVENPQFTTTYFDVKLSDFLTIQLPRSITAANFTSQLIAALNKAGIPGDIIWKEIESFQNLAIRAIMGGGNNINGGSTASTNRLIPPNNETVIPYVSQPLQVVVRVPSGGSLVDTTGPGGNPSNSVRPSFRQAYINSDGTREEESFYFDYVPSTISYTLGGSQWNEIPRSLGVPIVEWSSYGLSRVQMTFLIAGKRIESQGTGTRDVPDGLNVDVEDKILQLRRMATRQSPIVMYGLDDIFNIQLQQAQTTGTPCNWAITDLSITAKRRTEGPPSLISVAQVNLSLIEFPVERTLAVRLGLLSLQVPTPTTGGGGDGQNAIRPDLWSPYLMKPVENTLIIATRTLR